MGVISQQRQDDWIAGLSKRAIQSFGDPVANIQLGDMSNTALSSQDADVLALLSSIPGAAPTYKVLGNHDVYLDARSPEAAASALGLPSRNWVEDLGFAYLVGIYPGDNQADYNNGSIFSAACLDWLEATLESHADKDVWIVCHFPLYDTVLGDVDTHWRSIDSGFFVADLDAKTDSSGVLSMLADYPHVKAWLSAHTHSDLATPGLFTMVTVGSRQIAHVNVSSLVPPDKGQANPLSSLTTMYLTWRDDSSIEIRPRNFNGGGWWDTVGGYRVSILSPT